MRTFIFLLVILLPLSLLGCGDSAPEVSETDPFHYNEILATKSPYAVAKVVTPVLKTYEWERVFGGEDGKSLAYDRFGEVDELEFIAPKGTLFYLKREIRRKLRSGETIFFQVSSDGYSSSADLWVDGRFLDIREILPQPQEIPYLSESQILEQLRNLEGFPYTWNGNAPDGVPELLEYYPPSDTLSARMKGDWMLEGVDSPGALYFASGGRTPLEESQVAYFGESVMIVLASEGKTKEEIANQLMAELRPLDLLTTGDHTWVVLDKGEVFQSRYRSNFDGGVTITPLLHTVVGLLEKRVYVQDLNAELADAPLKPFAIRRWFAPPSSSNSVSDTFLTPVRSTEDVLRLRGSLEE